MPTKTKDYPLYTYDEPAVYRDFSGGINTDPSNEHLLNNELRDCVNMTYLSGALVKRKGAKKLCDISCSDTLTNIQGIFLFTYRITYIIIAADGKLYKGIYNDDATIELSLLPVIRTRLNPGIVLDPEDAYAGLEEKNTDEVNSRVNHEGYIQVYYKNRNTGVEYPKNDRGVYFDIAGGSINVGDIVTVESFYEKKYLCIKSFDKEYEYPSELHNWELVGEDGLSFETVHNGEQVTLTPSDMVSIIQSDYQNYGLKVFSLSDLRQWETTDYTFYGGKFYHCINPHKNRYNSYEDPELFIEISSLSSTDYEENSYMFFQNYRKVEAATINNKLYIATGTRIIEVYLQNNELMARPIPPYLCNYTEITKIGYNYMSPYPELAVASQLNTVTTSITGVKVTKLVGGKFLLHPVMNIQYGDSIDNYYFRWEKLIDGVWYVIIPFVSQKTSIVGENGNIEIGRRDFSSIEVYDADQYLYRCTFAKSFELETKAVQEWDITKGYNVNDYVSVGAHVYKCLVSHQAGTVSYVNNEFDLYGYPITFDYEGTPTVSQESRLMWEEVFDLERLPYAYYIKDENDQDVLVRDAVYDYKIAEADGEYFGSAVSVLFNNELSINDNFLLINSCTKVLADGQKLLFYDDRYNSGQWFKTIINNPNYITDRGCLSFKTTKNESVIKVIPFQGNLIVFANADNVGGSIHLVQGNGDDYDDQSGYYSPYQRRTINSSISSSNPDSIQVCDNIIVFKYFDRVYYINASDLNNDTVKVTPCNDRIQNTEGEVKIPWADDECISEVTSSYYALIWKEKYTLDSSGELMLDHPGIRVKMYYKMSVQYDDNNYGLPWLRDEGEIFNSNFIIYIKGQPVYLYNNILVSFDKDYYKDLDKDIVNKIHFKAVDMNYESFLKLVHNCMVSFYRNQYNNIDLDVIIKNEAGHVMLNTMSKRHSANDLGILKLGRKFYKEEKARIGSTIQDTKLINTVNMFPCLFADTEIIAKTDGSFTLSGITYSYTTIDAPDQNPTDVYEKIIRRPEDMKNG